jgi:hypothetical protein
MIRRSRPGQQPRECLLDGDATAVDELRAILAL